MHLPELYKSSKHDIEMSAETLTTISPVTNNPIITRPGVSAVELASLPQRGQDAFRSFSRSTSLGQRQEIVARALGLLAKKKDILAREVTEQMGRPIAYTGGEITTAIKRGEYLNRISSTVLGDEGTLDTEEEAGFKRYIKKEPVGVVLIIFPWNVSFNVWGRLLWLLSFSYTLKITPGVELIHSLVPTVYISC